MPEQVFDGSESLTTDITEPFGSFRIHRGSLSEVCTALIGCTRIRYVDFFWDGEYVVAVEPL